MFCRFVCVVGLIFLVFPMTTWALVLQPTSGLSAPARLIGELTVRCSADLTESIEEITHPAREKEFVALSGPLLRGYTSDICWLRFDLQRTQGSPAAWLLEVGIPILDSVALYIPDPEASSSTEFTEIRLGDRLPYVERLIPHRRFVFPLQLPEKKRFVFICALKRLAHS